MKQISKKCDQPSLAKNELTIIGISTAKNDTKNTFIHTFLKYLRTDKPAILRKNRSRNSKQQIEMNIATIYVDSGGKPICKHK